MTGDSTADADAEERIERLDPDDDPVERAETLADGVEAVDDRERAAEWVDRIATVYADDPAAAAEPYARALAALVDLEGADGDLETVADRIEELREVHDEHRSEPIALDLADALVSEAKHHHERDDGDPGETHANLQFVDNLSREYPGEALSERLAAALNDAARASYDQGDYDDVRRKANRIEGLYQQYPTDEIARQLGRGSQPKVWADCRAGDVDAVEDEIERVESLVDDHDDDDLRAVLAHDYRNAAWVRFDGDDSREGERTLDRLAEYYEDNADVDDVIRHYATGIQRAADQYVDEGAFDRGADHVAGLADLYERHRDDDAGIAGQYGLALASAVEARLEADDVESARERLDRLRDLRDAEGEAVAEPFGRAVEAMLDTLLDEDPDAARDLVDEFTTIAADSAEKRRLAALSTRVRLEEGRWGLDPDDYDVTVETEREDSVDVRIVDPNDLKYLITVEDDGYVKTHTGEGDVPGDWSDVTGFQRRLAELVRGYAYRWVEENTAFDLADPESRPENVRAVLAAVESTSADAFADTFETYLDQHASHFDSLPFVDPVERPVDTDEADLENQQVRYGAYVAVEDGEVVAVSDPEVVVLEEADSWDEDDEWETVVERDVPEAGKTVARIEMPIRPLVVPEPSKEAVVASLRCQLRDCHVWYGIEPSADVRVVGPGMRAPVDFYEDVDEVPTLCDPTADVPGYETGRSLMAEVSAQLRALLRGAYAEDARAVVDAYENAPEPALEGPETTNPAAAEGGE